MIFNCAGDTNGFQIGINSFSGTFADIKHMRRRTYAVFGGVVGQFKNKRSPQIDSHVYGVLFGNNSVGHIVADYRATADINRIRNKIKKRSHFIIFG